MKNKLLWALAACLILTATACRNSAEPSAAPPAGLAQPDSTGTASSPASSNAIDQAAQAQPPQAGQGGPQTGQAAVPPAGQDKQQQAAAEKPAPKLYKLNAKSYDIVPIDPEATSKKVVLLTFDDGPKDKDMLEPLLDTLDKHHAKAIFFVNGYRVKQHPELLKLIQERGQTIGNHSWDHIDLKKEGEEKVDQQIGDVQAIVKEATGSSPQFFRPPFGSGGDIVRAKVKEENMLFMTWSNGSKDWEMSTKSNDPDKVVANVLEQLRPGSNILMHELPWTVKALDKLLTELEGKEYGFVDPSSIDIGL
ncbi:Peptidoglycan-N-acetylglucosamine deacetylase [Paenibacillus konkukensis]|uniref:Peptidoglycan-N-acetylglucosamine deacetylase n=1 Tax=Paenibacillus konkukensis TaxID=2020716 RepID=A0ABY4RHU4_9BACL|nr:polysaccharide deacetylase family protein [Paenibacillus konkukensis]UQZ81957.1 Peptidoglycan-N-acetylglucosamine deacetylase [Paenibacillus konkukensis]